MKTTNPAITYTKNSNNKYTIYINNNFYMSNLSHKALKLELAKLLK